MITYDFDLLDEDGYPTEEVLKFISEFKDYDSINELFEFIRDNLWWHPDSPGKWINFRHCGRVLRYRMATGGWSGNESIIQALKDNFIIFPARIPYPLWAWRNRAFFGKSFYVLLTFLNLVI